MNKQIGEFHLSVWDGGSPAWVLITHPSLRGGELKFDGAQLSDLEYLVACAKRALAKQAASSATAP